MKEEPAELRRWRAAPHLLWAHYDDSNEWVVYHPGSCDTHLVTAAAHRLWSIVSDQQPRSVHEIAIALASDTGRPVDTEMTMATAATLEFMDRAGLLHPA